MSQFLMAFGSESLADRVAHVKLNCDSRVIEEKIQDERALLNVELDCECIDPDGENVELENLKGEWKIYVER